MNLYIQNNLHKKVSKKSSADALEIITNALLFGAGLYYYYILLWIIFGEGL